MSLLDTILHRTAVRFIAFLKDYAASSETDIDDMAVKRVEQILIECGVINVEEPAPGVVE